METELFSNIQGNVRALRDLWSLKSKKQDISAGKSIPNACFSQKKKTDISSNNERKMAAHSSLDDKKNLAEMSTTFANDMANLRKNKIDFPDSRVSNFCLLSKNRRLIRNALIFTRTRRASDSILHLFIEIHKKNYSSNSCNELLYPNLIQNLFDDRNFSILMHKFQRSRSIPFISMHHTQFGQSTNQYLKTYEKYLSSYSLPPIPPTIHMKRSKFNDNSYDTRCSSIECSMFNHQTVSSVENTKKVFTEFATSETALIVALNQEENTVTSDSSLTTFSNAAISNILNELDSTINAVNVQISLQSDNGVNDCHQKGLSNEKMLMKILFEGRKTAFCPKDLDIKPIRLPKEMRSVYELAKKKCVSDAENLVYVTKIFKISRRGYKQDARILFITTKHLYNIDKTKPHVKECLLLGNIKDITCTPYNDGFICIHTKTSNDDRGDWLLVVSHPCEFIMKIFTALERINNNDDFLRIESKFTHCCRYHAGSTQVECFIESRKDDHFYIKKIGSNGIVIYTP